MRPNNEEGPRRLKELEGATPGERFALDALRATTPLSPTADVRRRRLAAIVARERAAARGRGLFVRPAVALALLLVAGGAVGATAGRPFIRATFERVTAAFRGQPPRQREPARPRDSSELSPSDVEVEPVAPAPTPALPLSEPRERPARAATRPAALRAPVKAAPAPAPATAPATATASRPEDELELVYEAMVALRKRGDRATAAKLSFAYLDRHPRGPMAEEALEIAREALSATDPARARELAREYLRRFPRGVYRAAALRTLEGEGGRR